MNQLLQKWLLEQIGLRPDEKRLVLIEQWLKKRFPSDSNREIRYFLSLEDGEKESDFWNLLTVKETYLFRETMHFEFLIQEVTRWLAEEKGPFTIWCAGCATGEEAYTLALILNRFGLENFRIIATDINPSCIQKAKEGIFADYSVRKVPSDILSAYFNKSNNSYCIHKQFKSAVNFFQMNIFKFPYPKALESCHAIFCRNVFIYMEEQAIQRILKEFSSSLRSEGLLFLGSSELLASSQQEFLPAGVPRAYRKTAPLSKTLTKQPVNIIKQPTKKLEVPSTSNKEFNIKEILLENDFDKALELCKKELANDPHNSELHFYMGIFLARISPDVALNAYRQAISLNNNHLQARYHLAELLMELERNNEAKQLFQELLNILNTKDKDELVDREEGLTVGFFIKACNIGLKGI